LKEWLYSPKKYYCVIFHHHSPKNECSSFPHESHAKDEILNGENKENTQMLVFLKEHTNHFPRMVVLFLG
jgi:hypothetical protein